MLSSRHRRTLAQIFERPVRADIRWSDVQALYRALGADVSEGSGSRVRLILNGVRAVFHRPHPRPEVHKGAVEDIRKHLQRAGISP